MEQHPVPQNVTTFQFRLIGDMTLKQFGYLCAGAILAFIAYKLPLPMIVTWPLAGVLAFLGVGFAFIPVEERPMDVWVFSFFRSIYSPTQYIWSHDQPSTANNTPQTTNPPPVNTAALPANPTVAPKTVLSGIFGHATPTAVSQKAKTPVSVSASPHRSFFDELTSIVLPPHKPQQPIIHPGVNPAPPQTQPVPPPDAIAASNESLHKKITALEDTLRTLEERLVNKTVVESRIVELQKQVTDLMQQKNQTEEELVTLKRQATPNPPPPAETSRGVVNVISTQEAAVKVGLPRLTNAPNVITGIVKDDTGNFLPGILVTVTNNESVPVRALKTNKLGQFAASTPLTNSTYFVEIEDPRGRFTFSRVQLTLTGGVVPVIEIIAKSEKTLTREKLAQEIFGKPI